MEKNDTVHTQMNEIELLCQKFSLAYIQFVHRFTAHFVGYLLKILLQLESTLKKIIGIIDLRANMKRTNGGIINMKVGHKKRQ